MVKNLLQAIKKHSKAVSYSEDFGLYREERTFDNSFINGTYTSIEFKTWNILNQMIYKINICNSEFYLTPKSKYMILNINQTNALKWIDKTDKTISIAPNTGIFLNTSKHNFKVTNTDDIHMILVEFKEEYFNQSLFNDHFQEYLTNTLITNHGLTFPINSNINSITSEIFTPKKVGLCQFMNLNNSIFELLSIVLNISEFNEEKKDKHPYHSQLEKVKKMIDANLNTQYSIEKLSKIAGLNTSYLKKYFKEAYNITLFEYAQKKRIKLAKKLLKKPELTVANISEKVGYQQSAHFSHAFKRNTGVSPNQYRKKYI